MILLYSSHGDAAEVYKACSKSTASVSETLEIAKAINDAFDDPQSLTASILDRRELKSLVQRSDPRFFLYLRELSVHIKKAYGPLAEELIGLGYRPTQNVLVRFCDGASPIEILSVGILAMLCGVKDLTVSLDRATMTPEIASACRLCDIERAILCDEVSCAGIAACGTRTLPPFSRLVGVGSEILGAACGMTGSAIEGIFYPEQKAVIFAQLGDSDGEALTSDVACCEKKSLPIVITSDEETARAVNQKYKEKEGLILYTSSDEETRAVLEKCKIRAKRLYGCVTDDVFGIRAGKASPLMLSVCSPDAVYPYKPTDFMTSPSSETVRNVTSFAGSIATFVEKSIISDAEIDAIGIRF
jgi:hypothetical protein